MKCETCKKEYSAEDAIVIITSDGYDWNPEYRHKSECCEKEGGA